MSRFVPQRGTNESFAVCTSFVARAISNDNNNKFQFAYRKHHSREWVCNESLKSFSKKYVFTMSRFVPQRAQDLNKAS